MMRPEIQETIDWLCAQGLPPLPIAPAQDPYLYPRVIAAKPDRGYWSHCPCHCDPPNWRLLPQACFTGKNPSYLDASGQPHLVWHTRYQTQFPTADEIRQWFVHPQTGIGTLGGWQDLVWIDIDRKQFESQSACDRRVEQWLDQYPRLQQTFAERTQSGGWRFAVKTQSPGFTNIAFEVGGHHVGEALGKGRLTVLAPTIGPSGHPYTSIRRVTPIPVESLEAIGLYPVRQRQRPRPEQPRFHPQRRVVRHQPGALCLEDLVSHTVQAILKGESPCESRSHSLALALQECYGWENWATQNQLPISGSAEDLVREAGTALGIDAERVERIIQSIADPGHCIPAVVYKGGEASAWKQVLKLDRIAYNDCCPENIKQAIQAPVRRHHLNADLDSTATHQAIALPQYLQVLVKDARYILARSEAVQLEASDTLKQDGFGEQKRSVQGRIYHLESDGRQLAIQAARRGTILRVEGDRVELARVTVADAQRFHAEVNRINDRQAALALPAARAKSCADLER